jgi:O-methyltransferase
MKNQMNSKIQSLLRKFSNQFHFNFVAWGLIIVPYASSVDVDFVRRVREFTLTSRQRQHALIDAVRYVCKNNIEGDIVECGVWRGGSMMLAALTSIDENDTSRKLWLYDTYEGMTPPTNQDYSEFTNKKDRMAIDTYKRIKGWCKASLEDVQSNMNSTGYPKDKLVFIKGDVMQTIPKTLPEKIALLRLDTDFYDSTLHEMTHLFPRLVAGGILILDDYGHWQGQRKATDEYLEKNKYKLFLQSPDYAGRVAVKL